MKDVWIVGRGESVKYLKKSHFGKGLVIVLGVPILKVESLDLRNSVVHIVKDGPSPEYLNECPTMACENCWNGNIRPQKSILFVHKNESMCCMTDYEPRFVFDSNHYGMEWRTETVRVIIEMALDWGYDKFHFLCFDAVTNGSDQGFMNDKTEFYSGSYIIQANRLKERVQTLNYEFLEPLKNGQLRKIYEV